MAKLGEGERQVRLGQDRLAIKQKQAESIYIVLPAPKKKALASNWDMCTLFAADSLPLVKN